MGRILGVNIKGVPSLGSVTGGLGGNQMGLNQGLGLNKRFGMKRPSFGAEVLSKGVKSRMKTPSVNLPKLPSPKGLTGGKK